jgi:O-antigen/teichoic acid export membrane protein
VNLLTRNAASMFAGQCLSVGFQVGYFVLLARLLIPAEYGIYMGVVALAAILSQYTALGSGFVFLKHVAPDRSRYRLYWGNTLLTFVIAGIPLILLLGVGAHWLAPKAGLLLTLEVGLGDSLLVQLTTCASQVFQTVEQMEFTAAVSFVSNLLRFLLVAGMSLVLHHASALQWASGALVVSGFAACIAITAVIIRLGKPQFAGLRFLAAHAGEGLAFAVTSSSVNAYNDLDKVMLTSLGMDAANGIYSVAYRVVNLCTIPITSICMAAVPSYFAFGAERRGESNALTRYLLKRTALIGCCGAVGMVLMAPLLPRFLGEGYVSSVSALRWLALIPLFRSVQWSAADVLSGMGRQNLRMYLQMMAVIFNLSLNFYLIPRYSWRGAAWSSLATDGLLGVVMWIALTHASETQPSKVKAIDAWANEG